MTCQSHFEKYPDRWPSVDELLVASFATAYALAKLLIEKGLITEAEYMEKLSQERGMYQRILEKINSEVGNA